MKVPIAEMPRPVRGWAAGLLLAVMVGTACGAGSTTPTGPVAPNAAALQRAKDAVAAMEAVPNYQGPTVKLDTSSVRGKTVYFIAFDLSNSFNAQILANFQEAAKLIGLNVVALSGRVNPALESQYIFQAVKQHAAGIVLLAVGHEEAPEALAAAQAAHIPVITMAQRSAGLSLDVDTNGAVTASTYHIGEVQADYAYIQSGGSIDAIGYGGASLPQDVDEWDGQQHELGVLCPNTCKYKSTNLDLQTFQAVLPNVAREAIIADPKLNWFLPDWDILGTYVLVGVKAANAQNRVKFSTWNGIPAALELVKNGDEAAEFGVPLRWWGWAAADMISRFIAGQNTPDENIPVRLFTQSILQTIGSTSDESLLYQDSKVFDTYRSLWGV